ncbi:MAG: thioredoxin domain-containing protein, partial [Candidatus Brocadiae bacterium]|nr:thioredoxin domain-containing protein [Candidatus Brocadiia bacterium]
MKSTPARGLRRLPGPIVAAGMVLLATAAIPPGLRAEEPAVPPAKDEFPFSHRPHRAREIAWRAWSPAVFEEAVRAGKPVAVSLTATWCQKCHEMDEKAFSDPRVIELLNRRFICIRVDTDRYPEIKDRYLSGKGWPTTAFCTPGGDPMSKVWYVEADEFLTQANAAADHWEKNRESILRKIAEYRPPPLPERTAAALEDVEAILAGIDATWAKDDSAWAAGDFRFPSPQNIELYAWKAAASGQKIWLDRAGRAARCTQALEDPVEFGYYRVAMKPDWSDPHFEKLLETNAGMLAALVTLWRQTGDEEWGKAASRTVEFLQATLRQAAGGWGASQDADAEYFALDRAGRSKRAVPHIDGAFYSGLNAQTASAFFAYAAVSGDAAAREAAVSALDRTFRELWSEAGLAHGGGAGVNLLRDLALAGDACLDAHQATGE